MHLQIEGVENLQRLMGKGQTVMSRTTKTPDSLIIQIFISNQLSTWNTTKLLSCEKGYHAKQNHTPSLAYLTSPFGYLLKIRKINSEHTFL